MKCLILICYLACMPCVFEMAELSGNIGPFKTNFVKTYPCESPKPPYEKDNRTIMYEAYMCNSTTKYNLLCSNMTVFKSLEKHKFIVKGFIWDNGRWTSTLVVRNGGCTGAVVKGLKVAMMLNTNELCIPKGVHLVRHADFDLILHMWLGDASYGNYKYVLHIMNAKATALCWEYRVDVIPDVKKKI